MRRPLVAGNWKMNGTLAFCDSLARTLAASRAGAVDVAVCPPFPYLACVAERLQGSHVWLGGQDMAAEVPGAFTGAVAGEMLLDLGCRMVILGHSERRSIGAESDALVGAKVARAMTLGLTPIVCVGETLEEREAGATLDVVNRQLQAVHDACGDGALGAAVLAYEPVWAIGTGRTASPQQAQDVHAGLRHRLAELGHDAQCVRVLYGGSVKPGNAAELFAMPDIDGGLIGGAALQADDFEAICRAAEE